MNRYALLRTLMALAYIAAGINHFVHPGTYRAIMPPWLPAHAALVAVSGVAEILLGAGLLLPRTRRAAAWGIVVLLVAVFPANIQMALNWWRSGHPHLWIALLRLPLQGLLIWWALLYTRRNN
ncbi:DoxX family membrane protein [Flaviaesturariibacter flavus]|uniref:DoxX family membrane protein n=1 Tax=Flaviaesturariibacter flavus TaxID=2502780 RepID=A0A4R1B5U1_9BACT|nr:DoxX family membrane protein [Flaviaesturariibacter flavus]TCJ13371.1 DoxX family membrane protein [Flaviaesturariibacter flavus]